jgi:hypothetical protein
MLWRKLLMCGTSSSALSTHWILPGGRILTLADGQLVTVDPVAGWPQWTDGGDPFRDAEGRIGTYEQLNHGGGVGEVKAIRLRDDGADREQPLSLGPYRGWASENVAVAMTETGVGHPGNPFGYYRPRWQLSSTSGGSLDTGYTADWPWEQQSNGTSGPQGGQSTNPEHVDVIKAHYTPNMAYEFGVCAARDLAVVTRLEATAMNGSDDVDPVTGRRWIGWTMDAAGTPRRIRDLTLEQVRAMARDGGFRPPDDDLITDVSDAFGWEFIRPVGPVGLNQVLCTGVLTYTQEFTRVPTMAERPWYLQGYAGVGRPDRVSIPLTDQPNDWIFFGRSPIRVTERRSCLVFVTFTLTATGIVGLPAITGSSVARSTSVVVDRSGNFDSVGYKVFRRRTGGYLFVVQKAGAIFDPINDPMSDWRYDGDTFETRFHYTPNGWRIAIMVPQRRTGIDGGGNDVWADQDGLMSIPCYPDLPNFGAQAPAEPTDWDEETQGPWVEPPFDPPPANAFWLGQSFLTDQGEVIHQDGLNNIGFARAAYGIAGKVNPYDPNGPYARDGAGQWYGRGQWIVARHADGAFSAHAAGLIVPGVVTGPAGGVPPHAEPDGSNPVMRLLRWPGRSWRLAMTQDGAWSMSRDGRTWSAIAGLGAMLGTLSVAAELADPPPGQDGG